MEVPLHKFSQEQKFWYAQLLASAVMADDNVDQFEVEFLKQAVGFLGNTPEQKKLMNMVQIKRVPLPSACLVEDKHVLASIFTELVSIVIADEVLATHEIAFLKDVSLLFDFTDSYHEQLMDWCRAGVKWRQQKSTLIQGCEQKTTLPFEEVEKTKVQSSKYYIPLKLTCFVCEGEQRITYHRHKVEDKHVPANIFGIPVYTFFKKKNYPVDFNKLKVAVCPNCYFSSSDPSLFRKDTTQLVPKLMRKGDFIDKWLGNREQFSPIIQPYKSDLQTDNRSLDTAIAALKMGYTTHLTLAKADDKTMDHQRAAVSILMSMSEVQASAGMAKDSVKTLLQARKLTQSIFSKLSEGETVKSARLLFYMGLYVGDLKASSKYLEYLRKMQNEKGDTLPPEYSKVLIANLMEMTQSWQDRNNFHRNALRGFCQR